MPSGGELILRIAYDKQAWTQRHSMRLAMAGNSQLNTTGHKLAKRGRDQGERREARLPG